MLYLSVDEETQSMEDLKVTTFIMHNWINISHHANERATEKITKWDSLMILKVNL